jgi:hypothetical protein
MSIMDSITGIFNSESGSMFDSTAFKAVATVGGFLLGTSMGMDPWTAGGLGALAFDYWQDGDIGLVGSVGLGIAGVGIIDGIMDFGVETLSFGLLDGDSGLGALLTGPLSTIAGLGLGAFTAIATWGNNEEAPAPAAAPVIFQPR